MAPCILGGRLLLQESFRRKGNKSWDDRLDEDILIAVGKWISNIRKCNNVSVSRNILFSGCEWQLHIFSDASTRGCSAVAYLRMKWAENIQLIFVWGKTKVNPMKEVSIPRLELVAAVLASKMRVRLEGSLTLKCNKTFMWTDSTTVLKYIQNKSERFNIFVANRITIIRERSKIEDWRYIPSEQNPADDGSRAEQSDRWIYGPEFLLRECEWPTIGGAEGDCTDLEVRATVCVGIPTVSPVDSLIASFSSWIKLKKAVGWFLIFKQHLRFKSLDSLPGKSLLPTVKLEEAECELIKFEQRKYFGDEMKRLEQGSEILKRSRLWKLDVFLCDGILRVGGRLKKSCLDWRVKHPVVLPRESTLVKLIVMETHVRVGHMGTNVVLGEIRELYWITKGNAAVRSILGRCITCRKLRGKTIQQKMGDLPVNRITSNISPFTNTGVDCFGPFIVRTGRKTEKRYGVIFTCLAMRAVHLDVATDLSTDGMCNAIRRFVARRGNVKSFLSDNGTNFRGARREILNSFANIDVRNRFLSKGIEWTFNPPGASHFGGVWESLIRVVRRVLEAMMGKQQISEDGLRTLLCEVEVCVNSRPLTFLSSDVGDLTPLTPNKLLTLGDVAPPWDDKQCVENYSRKRWRQVQHYANIFWNRWCKEYRNLLQGRRKWTKSKRNAEVGDVVLIVSDTEARCHWPMGKVVTVMKGQDKLVRSVEVLVNKKIYRRPVSKLVLILESEDLI